MHTPYVFVPVAVESLEQFVGNANLSSLLVIQEWKTAEHRGLHLKR
jgi:hypothetical protein